MFGVSLTIVAQVSLSANSVSFDVIVIVCGNPVTKSLPRTSNVLSDDPFTAEPISKFKFVQQYDLQLIIYIYL